MIGELHQLLEGRQGSLLFAGVGNVLKKDDGVGVYITREIIPGNGIARLTVEMGIENHIGKINSLAPGVLVITDAADFGAAPGYARLVPAEEMQGITTNTHNISLAKISELFIMPVFILGVQPSDISFGEGLCKQVSEAAGKIVRIINSYSASIYSSKQSALQETVIKEKP